MSHTQVDKNNKIKKKTIQNLGMVNCFTRVAKEEGFVALWRGNMGTFESTLSRVAPEIMAHNLWLTISLKTISSDFFLSHSMVLSNVAKLILSVISQLKQFLSLAKTNIKAGLLE